MYMSDQPIYHKNAAGGKAVKGVECKFCGERVGLVQSRKSGRWYTCQLNLTMNPDKNNQVAYPWMPHFPYCKVNQRAQEIYLKTVSDAEPDAEDWGMMAAAKSQAREELRHLFDKR